MLRSILRSIWFVVAFSVIAVAMVLGSARWLLPLAGDYHDEIAQWVSEILGHPVEIVALGASWHDFGPSLELDGVTIFDQDGKRILLQCKSARIDIDLLASLRRLQLELDQLTVGGAHVSVLRREDGSLTVMGLSSFDQPDTAASGAFKQWLARQPRLTVEDSVIEWRDLLLEGRHFRVHGQHVQIRNLGERHRLDAQLALPDELGRQLTLTVDMAGDLFIPDTWSGDVYLRGDGVRLDAWGTNLLPEVELRGGRADVEVWSVWRNGLQRAAGTVRAVDAQLTASTANDHASSLTPPQRVTLDVVQGQFEWQRKEDGWELNADRASLRLAGGVEWPLGQARLVYREAPNGARRLDAGFSYVNIEDALAIARAARALTEAQDARLVSAAPRGELRDLYLRYEWGGASTPRTFLRTGFQHVALSRTAAIPGVGALGGSLVIDGNDGAVSLRIGAGRVDGGGLFRASLPLQSVTAHVAWRKLDGSLQIGSDDVVVRNEDIHGRVAFRLLRLDGMTSPFLDLHADFADGDGAHATRYLPVSRMHVKAVSWLDRAIVGGRVTRGEARLNGWLNEFPFDRGQGVFSIGFNVTDGILDYTAGWPRLHGIDTDVRFHGRSLQINADAADVFGSNVTGAQVTIADLTGRPAVVNVVGSARGPTADVARFIMESPLRNKFGEYLGGIEAEGRSRLDLDLALPLANQPARVRGTLYFDDSTLRLKDVDMDIAGIEGALDFHESGLRGRGIRAHLLDQPAVIDVRSEREGAAYATVFDAQGTADAAAIAKRFFPALASRVEGETPWRGSLKVMSSQKGGTRLQISSPLTGVAIELPEPLAKTVDQERRLTLNLPLPLKGRRAMRVRYGAELDAHLLLASESGGMALRRGELRLGGGTAQLPDEDVLRVHGRVQRLAVAEWLGLRETVNPAVAGTATGLLAADVLLTSDVLQVMGQTFNSTTLRARRTPQAWEVELDGPAVAGTSRMSNGESALLSAEFARLYLASPASNDAVGKAAGGDIASDPRSLPNSQVRVNDFRYGKLELGTVALRTLRTEHGMHIESLTGQSPLHKLDVQGRWEVENGRQQSAFSIAFDSEDVGGTLRQMGYADVIEDGKMDADMNVTWAGGPGEFALARAAGAISFKIRDGRLLDVNPGAGRVLGLLSFQALPRRLSLDFSDFFQKGLAFDRIEGDFRVKNGVAETDNLSMNGPAARIIARGRVGLIDEDYDQRVTVIPNMSAGLPWAGALAGGVATGAAMFLLERLLKQQIDEMGRIEYRVTGPWTAPVVERASSVAKDATRK